MEGKQPKTLGGVLDRYKRGDRDFAESELDDSYLDLSGVCLDGADFSRSFITACFQSASLRGTCFFEANVKTCDFRNADLRDADFSGAAICATQFAGARMEGARFGQAHAYGHELKDGELPDW